MLEDTLKSSEDTSVCGDQLNDDGHFLSVQRLELIILARAFNLITIRIPRAVERLAGKLKNINEQI